MSETIEHRTAYPRAVRDARAHARADRLAMRPWREVERELRAAGVIYPWTPRDAYRLLVDAERSWWNAWALAWASIGWAHVAREREQEAFDARCEREWRED